MILGFLAGGALHGYELRRRMEQLHGFARPISDGSLYPAIARLVKAGWVLKHAEPGRAAAQRHVLSITPSGRDQLIERLRGAAGPEVTDLSRFLVVLAFLSLVPEQTDRQAVLRRRLEFLDQPASFFYTDGQPLAVADVDDSYRKGMLTIARATSRAERYWLRSVLDDPKETIDA